MPIIDQKDYEELLLEIEKLKMENRRLKGYLKSIRLQAINALEKYEKKNAD